MRLEKFEEFLFKVREGNESFMLHTDSITMYMQAPVNEKAKIIFADYTFHHCDASDVMKMKFTPVAIVCDKNVYICDDYHFRAGDTVSGFKWEDHFPGVIRLDDLLVSTRALLLSQLIPELYENLPKAELNEERIDSAKQEARRRLLHKELCDKKKPLARMDDLLTKEDFIRNLCGELNLEEHVTEKYLKSKEVRANVKAYEEEVQKHVDFPVCAAWELELADAIYNAKAKVVNMTFSFEGKTATAKIKVDEFLREFMNGHDIDWWCFSTSVEGKRILKELGSDYHNRLYPHHIDEITYGGKCIYVAGDEVKSLRGNVLENEDYER